MKNIHVLPTDKPSRLVLNSINNDLFLTTTKKFPSDIMKFKNIYITSDEEIKEGDWVITPTNDIIEWAKVFRPNGKKIILTTNTKLIRYGVQAIDDEFLEWFVKNPSCEWVEIREGFADGTSYGYKIIIPKEEQKQETLNEVALEFAKDYHELYETNNLGAMHFGFCWGAKWQQERMYSEEEVKHLMTLAFEQGFKKADVVEAGLEAKETDTEVNWIFLKHKK